jgi:hypothetical protein
MVGPLATIGVLYVAYGKNARREARLSAESLARVHPRWPVQVITDGEEVGWAPTIDWPDLGTPGRWAKVNLDQLTPWDQTLFLDADTRVYDKLDVGFAYLDRGWDMVIVPSIPQGGDLLGHCSEFERKMTLWECRADPLQLNTGVIWFQTSYRTKLLFRAWRSEWMRFKDKDQGALLRALEQRTAHIAILGRPFNGGAVVGHRFGMARA